MNKEEAYQHIEGLVKRFEEHYESYHKQGYNETQTRRDFIDPFFSAFDWDVDNKKGYAEAYREVIHEDKVKVGKDTKRPDYSFRIGDKILFFVEAKKPSVELKDNIEPSYQLRRYAWSAKLPISVLTDFEELCIYDTVKKPNPKDKASVGRIKYITYKDYLKEFDFLWSIFFKENIHKGQLDKYISTSQNKKGTDKVDDEFLASLDSYRTHLAENIIKLNKNLNSHDINFVVQQTIDRIIFLRIAEDRGIEEDGSLIKACAGDNYYKNLYDLFLKADSVYNSGLFDFSKDSISKSIVIDNKVIKEIIKDLYYPCPYAFSVMPVEILGSAYEQFLGKTIAIDKNNKVKIEEKPEVRKAGGVYYTPEYIVNYIVENTIGEMIKGKSPKDIEKIKIVDPACGSGSFLLGAYKYLLDYHKKYYNERQMEGKGRKDDVLTPNGELSTQTKKRILINNIYGVDIDVNAVEVTKLSLLLQCLDGETPGSIQNNKTLFSERVLPSLEDNIKCGNSLIGSDFYTSYGNLDLDDEAKYKINCFDWQREFKEVFSAGGFDVVIGNPPYVKIQTMSEASPITLEALKEMYESASSGNIDIYLCFVEKALRIIKEDGLLGYILPNKFFEGNMGENLREIVSKKKALKKVVYFGANQVFANATTYTCLLFLSGSPQKKFDLLRFYKDEDLKESLVNQKFVSLSSDIVGKDTWNFHNKEILNVLNKLKDMPIKLSDITRKIFQGIATSADDIYVLEGGEEKKGVVKTYSKSLDRVVEIEMGIIKPFLLGKDIKRYQNAVANRWVIFPYKIHNNTATLFTQKEIKENFPKAWEYFVENKKGLEDRERGRMRCKDFYSYIYPKNLLEFETPKISIPDISLKSNAVYDDNNLYHSTTIHSLAFKNISTNPLFILGIINSPLFTFYVRMKGTVVRGGYTRFNPRFMDSFAVPNIDIANKDDKAKHDKLVSLVDSMLATQKKLASAKSPQERDNLLRQSDAIDEQIDAIVYGLYGLTEEEVRVVEG